tara:strand:+ start:620 stop:805 length:186 start_codon:yes stop_codon:yes gene_type:complete
MDKIDFRQWKEFINKIIIKKTNLDCKDLPDIDYWNYWNNNYEPDIVADIVHDMYINCDYFN